MSGPTPDTTPRILGLAIAVAAIAMVGGLGIAVVAAAKTDFIGAGACLLASAVAAGLIANAVLRR